jgi:outer membrane protein OmpA-like peptidoglycan-associated protein/ABC-type nitrate/sulfonate/bicarbonate transport system substrate-binding protein
MEKLTTLSKLMIGAIVAGSTVTALRTYGKHGEPLAPEPVKAPQAIAAAAAHGAPGGRVPGHPFRVAISQWPGHMPLVVAAGGLATQKGSPAAAEGLDLQIVFIEDAPSKNKALEDGDIDAVWQTVDELPISLGAYKQKKIDVRAFIQIDWSRGGDACVSSREVQKIEDIVGRQSAVLMFSPDHTVFEFMLTNSRLTPDQVADARKATKFSMDDFTYARKLFAEKKIDVACLWEPDVTLALASRPGAHRLFSTADATELVADTLVARKSFLDENPDLVQKLARAWFAAVEKAEKDRPAAARLISTACSRFRDELGYEKTLAALDWAKWTSLTDNVRFFGLDGSPPAFDRVYNQADGIWINYPEAKIEDRFAPSTLRDADGVRKVWEASGKPVAASKESYDSEVARTGSAVFTKPVSITFASGSEALNTEAMATINQQVLPQLLIAGGMYARVEGNTDALGDRFANQSLSERRAQSIVYYLVTRGVAPDRLVARGNGAAVPIAPNTTPEGRALNRRTDILFIRRPRG